MPQETYNLLTLDEDIDNERGCNARYAPLENMLAAAHLITSLLLGAAGKENQTDSNGVYAILGGFSMQLRGGRQSTRDIDIVTSLNMKKIWHVITGVDSLVIPDSRLVEGIIKVFVKTGQPWDECHENHRIEVDINQAGFMGSPRNFANRIDVVGPFDFHGKAPSFHLLDIPSMIKIKVDCCLSREEARDFEDVGFMITSHTGKVQEALDDGVVDRNDLYEVLSHPKMLLQEPNKLAGLLGLEDDMATYEQA